MNPQSRALLTAGGEEWKKGWTLVLSAALGMGTGVPMFMIVAGVFIQPMNSDLGWSRTELAMGPMVGLLTALFLFGAGPIVDRLGTRRSGLLGLTTLSVAFFLMALLPTRKPIVLCLLVLMGAIAGPLTSAVAFTPRLVANFYKYRGTALGVSMAGATLVSVATIPTIATLIADHGWRAGFLALGCLTAFIGVPAVALQRRGEQQKPPIGNALARKSASSDWLRVLITCRFWVLISAIITAGLPIGGILASMQPILHARGYDPKVAGVLGSIFLASVVFGRLAGGALLDRLWAPGVAGLSVGLSAWGAVQLLHLSAGSSAWGIAVGAVLLLGFSEGGEGDYFSFFTARLFDIKLYAKVMGIVFGCAYLSVSAGGLGFAVLFDRTGSYNVAIWTAATLYLISATAFLCLGLFKAAPTEGPAGAAAQ